MRRAGLSEGTVSVYIQMLDPPSFVTTGLNLAHALAETSHAPDLTDAQLKELVERSDTGLQPGMYLMMCTGAHAADIARLMRHQVEYDVKSNRLEVTWFVTKIPNRGGCRASHAQRHHHDKSPLLSVQPIRQVGHRQETKQGGAFFRANTRFFAVV
ncbi:MAG: hypothetical protein JW384_02512 [Nitrosomonadaceae bacterium]|nr:hypothetical protein [Nitrosomonadaceae bacterium]